MYTLYYSPGACSLATQAILHELGLPVSIVDKSSVEDFDSINPVGTVPVLIDGDITYNEGASILLHILGTKENTLLAASGPKRSTGIEAIMFANATMHPAYSKLFFGARAITDEAGKQVYFDQCSAKINKLWRVVNSRVGDKNYLLSDTVSPADILLTVYSNWGQYFPISIDLGKNTERMIANVRARDSFQKAVAAEAEHAVKAA